MAVDGTETDDIGTPEELGEYLRQLRGRLTQQTVANRSVLGPAALTRQRVSNIENGLLPTAEQLRCFLQGCGRPELFDALDVVRRRLAAEATSGGERRAMIGKRWRLAALGTSAVAVAAMAAMAVTWFGKPDESAPPDGKDLPECAQGSVCFWPEPDFGGTRYQTLPDYAGSKHCIELPFTARSAMNSSDESQKGYPNPDCSGQETYLARWADAVPTLEIRSYQHS
jgi:transcriptional regulator with XRE-family HTH domain